MSGIVKNEFKPIRLSCKLPPSSVHMLNLLADSLLVSLGSSLDSGLGTSTASFLLLTNAPHSSIQHGTAFLLPELLGLATVAAPTNAVLIQIFKLSTSPLISTWVITIKLIPLCPSKHPPAYSILRHFLLPPAYCIYYGVMFTPYCRLWSRWSGTPGQS